MKHWDNLALAARPAHETDERCCASRQEHDHHENQKAPEYFPPLAGEAQHLWQNSCEDRADQRSEQRIDPAEDRICQRIDAAVQAEICRTDEKVQVRGKSADPTGNEAARDNRSRL